MNGNHITTDLRLKESQESYQKRIITLTAQSLNEDRKERLLDRIQTMATFHGVKDPEAYAQVVRCLKGV